MEPQVKKNSRRWRTRILVFLLLIGLTGLWIHTHCNIRKLVTSLTSPAIRHPGEIDSESPDRLAEASKPILVPDHAYTNKDFLDFQIKWARKTMIESYKKVGVKNAAWDASAYAFLELIAKCCVPPGTMGVPTMQQRIAACRPLMDSACTDPLIQYLIGAILQQNSQYKEAEPFLRRSVEGFNKVKYPKALAHDAAICLGSLCKQFGAGREKEADRWLDLAVQWLAEAAREGSYVGDERRLLCLEIRMDLAGALKSRAESLCRAITATRGADPWVVEITAGDVNYNKAWDYRGEGYADEVTEHGWIGFEKYMKVARKHLIRAWNLHPQYPEAPALMIAVVNTSGAEPGESPRLWFDRAVVWRFDYPPAYKNMLYALLPRWGGSSEALYQFGVRCLETGRFDTAVPYYLNDALWKITEYEGDRGYWRRQGVYDNLLKMYEGMIPEESNVYERERLKAEQLAAAWRCGSYEDAKRLFPPRPGWYDTYAFWSFGTTWELAKGEVMAATGPAGKDIPQAENLFRDEKCSEAYPLFVKALKSEKDHLALLYLRDRVAKLRIEKRLEVGEWADLTPSSRLDGWRVQQGRAMVEKDGASNALSTTGDTRLICMSRVGDRFEIRGEVEVPPGVQYYSADIFLDCQQIGYVYGPETIFNILQWGGAEVRIYQVNTVVARQSLSLSPQRNTFRVEAWDHHFSAYVNDQLVLNNVVVKVEPSPAMQKSRVGILAQHSQSTGSLRFRNLRIRRLTSNPMDKAATADQHARS